MLISVLTFVFSFLATRLNQNPSGTMVNRAVVTLCLNLVARGFRNLWDKVIPVSMIKTQVVKVAEGELRGREVKSTFTGDSYFSFQGIPYAKPPVGPLRFKPPEPIEPWNGVRNALREGHPAPQADFIFHRQAGNEDCLYLNVYTPKLPSDSSEPLPVLFWIHGGAFIHGSGSSDLYGPEYLIQHNIIIVTCNYRLGVLGFLSLDNEEAPGNAGLKDQLMALRWVHKNISAFGGDPNNITIFGESAGSASVHYHILSPQSKGLFHRAIMQSGSSINPWAFISSGSERAFRLGEVLGCKTEDEHELIEFLRKVPSQDFVKHAFSVLTKEEKINNSLPFIPTLESPGPNAFLTEHPRTLLEEGRFNKVPCIFGVNSCEGMLFLRAIKVNKKLESRIENNPAVLTQISFQKALESSPNREEFIQKFRKIYFDDKPICKENRQQLLDVYSDYVFVRDILYTLQYHVNIPQHPNIYFERFSFVGSLGFLKNLLNGLDLKGACHGDDLGYIFPLSLMGLHAEKDSPEEEMIHQMTSRIANFVKTGDPNNTWSEQLKVKWNPISKDNLCFLDIDSTPSMKTDLFRERMLFWDETNRMLGVEKYAACKL